MPSSIQDLLNRISNARYGEQVRSAIHDSIEQCYADVSNGVTLIDAAVSDATSKGNTAQSQGEAARQAADRLDEYLPDVQELTPELRTVMETWNNTTSKNINAAINNANENGNNAKTYASQAQAIVTSWTRDGGISQQIATAISNAETQSQSAGEIVTSWTQTNGYRAQITAAIDSASDQAERAENAADYINGLTVSSEDVGPEATANATLRTVDGHADIHFVLKQGRPGTNFTIKGSAYATLSDLEAATSTLNPQEGDLYNVGPGSPTPYDIYRWTGSSWSWQGQIGVSFDDLDNTEIDTLWNETAISSTTSKYINHTGLLYLIANKIKSAINSLTSQISSLDSGKVDKRQGYDLVSTAAFSSLQSALSSKVDKRTGYDLVSTETFSSLQSDVSALKATVFTITLPTEWSDSALTVLDVKFLANGYVYQVSPTSDSINEYTQCQIYADDITTNGSIVFHCSSVPSNSLTVKVVRLVSA